MHEECRDNLLGSLVDGGVRGGGAERGRGKGLKGGTGVGVAVGAGSSYLNTAGLFH